MLSPHSFCVELNQASLPSVRQWKSPEACGRVWCQTSPLDTPPRNYRPVSIDSVQGGTIWSSAFSTVPALLDGSEGPAFRSDLEAADPPMAHFSPLLKKEKTGKSFCGFMWDSSSGLDLKEATILESTVTNGNGTHSQPGLYKALFTVGSYELKLVNVHMHVGENGTNGTSGKNGHGDEHKPHRLSSVILDTLRAEKELVVLGDFGCPPQASELDVLRKEKFCALVSSSQCTNISTRSPQGTRCLDNIWISKALKKIYGGQCVVVREGMTNPWIPDNWSWGAWLRTTAPSWPSSTWTPAPKTRPRCTAPQSPWTEGRSYPSTNDDITLNPAQTRCLF
ncbi:hypothetical protein WMY93_020460 [Mugilogobius chulae]|uniref:Uncharacterized protein n=1 Tax=Mugilogobius chulae TaxID=88201 RepID=A0AAW0NS44_9GOBI